MQGVDHFTKLTAIVEALPLTEGRCNSAYDHLTQINSFCLDSGALLCSILNRATGEMRCLHCLHPCMVALPRLWCVAVLHDVRERFLDHGSNCRGILLGDFARPCTCGLAPSACGRSHICGSDAIRNAKVCPHLPTEGWYKAQGGTSAASGWQRGHLRIFASQRLCLCPATDAKHAVQHVHRTDVAALCAANATSASR
jgi:hypothetical protein